MEQSLHWVLDSDSLVFKNHYIDSFANETLGNTDFGRITKRRHLALIDNLNTLMDTKVSGFDLYFAWHTLQYTQASIYLLE